MAYNPTTQVISAPVSLGDIASALGGGSLDLGTLCISDSVNMWARRKPVRSSVTGILTDAQFTSLNCGVVPPSYSDMTSLMNRYHLHYKGGVFANNGWAYNKPRGGGNTPPEWYRALDFDGYKHNSVAVVAGASYPSVVRSGNNLTVTFALNQTTDDGMVLSDLGGLADMYVGVYLRQQTGGSTYQQAFYTSQTKLGQMSSMSVSISTSGFNTGDYRVYPFISPAKLESVVTNPNSLPSGFFPLMTLPMVDYGSVPISTETSNILHLTDVYIGADGKLYASLWASSMNVGSAAQVTALNFKMRPYGSSTTWGDTVASEVLVFDTAKTLSVTPDASGNGTIWTISGYIPTDAARLANFNAMLAASSDPFLLAYCKIGGATKTINGTIAREQQ